MTLKSKHGQTPLEIATEFIENMRKMPSGGPDMERMLEHAITTEKSKQIPPEVYPYIKDVCHTGYDATTSPIIVNCKINYSPMLLSYICSQSRSNPEMINVMLGFYAVVFYSTHKKEEQLTLEWVIDQIGTGKVIYSYQFFLYAQASKTDENVSMFTLITPEELYTHK